MTRNTFEMYWSYYLSIEDMLQKTNQYVSHSENNESTYSDEFAKIILLSCSEVDSLLKVLCNYKSIVKDGRYYNMASYAKGLISLDGIKDYAMATYPTTIGVGIFVHPFKDISLTAEYAGLYWWKGYQQIKHDRLANSQKGNLKNACCSVAAHYIILRKLIDFLEEGMGKEYVLKNNCSKFWVPVV